MLPGTCIGFTYPAISIKLKYLKANNFELSFTNGGSSMQGFRIYKLVYLYQTKAMNTFQEIGQPD